jgi:hypothetical protein
VLAEHLDRVLDEVLRRSAGVVDVPPASSQARDTDPLDAPITEEFRVGTMTIAWDPSIDRIVIELFSMSMSWRRARRTYRRPPPRSPTRSRRRGHRGRSPVVREGFRGQALWLRADRRVPSVCSRSTRTGTFVPGQTATVCRCPSDPL